LIFEPGLLTASASGNISVKLGSGRLMKSTLDAAGKLVSSKAPMVDLHSPHSAGISFVADIDVLSGLHQSKNSS